MQKFSNTLFCVALHATLSMICTSGAFLFEFTAQFECQNSINYYARFSNLNSFKLCVNYKNMPATEFEL